MTNRRSIISPGKLFPLIFHLVLWTIWIGFPFFNSWDNEKFLTFSTWMLPISFAQIPFFFFNTEWLIPGVFKQRGVAAYLLSLVAITAVFSVVTHVYKELLPDTVRFRENHWYWSIMPTVFIVAVSTGYGFIVYLLDQEKGRQEEQQERLTSELSFLRSQISPHFIFNILNSIVYLIRTKSDQAETVTIKLSELMRYMLYTPQEEQIPLEQELDYLGNYVALQQTRFEEDVKIRFVREGIGSALFIEPMILIPFVENAFKHGVGMITDPVIEVLSKVEGEVLTFEVRNKFSPDLSEDKDNSSGIGLKNVRRRLELLYPGKHDLFIQEVDGWFEVQLRLTPRAIARISPLARVGE
ncbi:MAG: histidine kinase [Bacteroidia bacterium]|nr:histidine kinase [Bacteroidia bacterium]